MRLEPLTLEPRSEMVTPGPPWQLEKIESYLSPITVDVLGSSLIVAILSGRTVAAAAEP